MKSISLKAPAKVNYRLDVLRRRADGYHDLRMVMQRINLCDDIHIKLKGSPGIDVICEKNGVPDGPGNIVWLAADTLLNKSRLNMGIEITITKNIPVAAGLGGGSSDAATVLMGLNELLALRFTDNQLMEIGVKLGADVPFFIFKSCALAEGIGERLTRIETTPELWLVLVNPNIHVSTAWVYQNLQLTSEKTVNIIPLLYNSISDICAILGNDLESVTINKFPIIGGIKERLLAAGATGSLMSGSGPTVFGVFEEEGVAERAVMELSSESDLFVKAVRTL